MSFPSYITLRQAKIVLADLGITLSDRQMKRAAEPGPSGTRKLPFFRDPIDGKLKIEKGELVKIYQELQVRAQKEFQENE